MVKIRLRRTGKTKQPSYRVVVADSRSPRDGRFIEIIGHYNPVQQPKVLNIKTDRARYWLGVGARPSDTVSYLFRKVGIFDSEGKLLSESADGSVEITNGKTEAPVSSQAPRLRKDGNEGNEEPFPSRPPLPEAVNGEAEETVPAHSPRPEEEIAEHDAVGN
ncbi:MAG: 30S ribosomal protein S16 [Chloroflexaceae bacterium]|nr:30S ribosomal protein S16 [Chloroflexaceae bacterium]